VKPRAFWTNFDKLQKGIRGAVLTRHPGRRHDHGHPDAANGGNEPGSTEAAVAGRVSSSEETQPARSSARPWVPAHRSRCERPGRREAVASGGMTITLHERLEPPQNMRLPSKGSFFGSIIEASACPS
jgi:hypothetical protein